jgi:hypothetical protein
MRNRVGLLFLLLLLGVLIWGGFPATAQESSWSQPFAVSDIRKTPSSWFPDIAIGPDGSVHIVWSSGLVGAKKEDGDPDLLMYRQLKDGVWSAINDINNPGMGGYTIRNSIIMGHDGRLHILERRKVLTAYLSAPWQTAWSAQAWSEPRNINGETSYFNALAMDSKGVIHIFWNEAVPDDPRNPDSKCSFCSDLFYRRSADGGRTWSVPINLSQSPEGSVKQQVKIDKNDIIHVVWEEGFDWYVSKGVPTAGMYRRSRDGGKTWDPPVRFTLPSVETQPPAATPQAGVSPQPAPAPLSQAPKQMTIGLYQETSPLVVYRSSTTDQIYFQYLQNDGKTWTRATPIPGIRARSINDGDHDDYSMTTDGAGNIHLICTGFLADDTGQDSAPKLLHVVWDGRAWLPAEVVAADPTYPMVESVTADGGKRLRVYPEWPRAVISGKALHLTWFTRNEHDKNTSEHAHYQVWYSVKQLNAPAVAPLLLFTPIPTAAPPTPNPSPVSSPTPTTLPKAILHLPPISDRPAWEMSGLFVIGLALLPAISLVALLLILVHRMPPRRG